jgi:hypothetical protein
MDNGSIMFRHRVISYFHFGTGELLQNDHRLENFRRIFVVQKLVNTGYKLFLLKENMSKDKKITLLVIIISVFEIQK